MHCHTYLSNSLYRLKVILIPSVLFILVFLVACPDSPFSGEKEKKTFRFTGTVTDANSGLPIADATVQVYNGADDKVYKSTVTDQEGRYDMVYKGPFGVPDPRNPLGFPQPMQLRAMAEGYETRYKQINRTGLLQTIDFQLPPIT